MEQINIAKISEEIISLKKEVAEIKHFIIDNLEFARRTEEAWQEIDEGNFSEYSTKEFFEKLKNDS